MSTNLAIALAVLAFSVSVDARQVTEQPVPAPGPYVYRTPAGTFISRTPQPANPAPALRTHTPAQPPRGRRS
jgi:hypothetical protein